MRHKYATPGLVLARSPLAESGMLVTLLTKDLGLIRARAEGVRRPGAKLAHALQTLLESDLMLVRGKEGWRLTGAVLGEDRFAPLSRDARTRAARVAGLVLRLMPGEGTDLPVFGLFSDFLTALAETSDEDTDAVESLAVLRLLHALGVDAGETPPPDFTPEARIYAKEHRSELVARINRGIAASHL